MMNHDNDNEPNDPRTAGMTSERETSIRELLRKPLCVWPREEPHTCVAELLDEVQRLKPKAAGHTVEDMRRLGSFNRGFQAGAGINTVEPDADADYVEGWQPLTAHDPLTCVCCQEAAGGLAAGRRAAQTAKELTSELLRVESALRDLCDEGRSPGEAAEHLAWQHTESCESEALLLEAVKDANAKMADQQAIHEHEMALDGRARASLIALCREIGVAIHTDASEGIRAEVLRLRAGESSQDADAIEHAIYVAWSKGRTHGMKHGRSFTLQDQAADCDALLAQALDGKR